MAGFGNVSCEPATTLVASGGAELRIVIVTWSVVPVTRRVWGSGESATGETLRAVAVVQVHRDLRGSRELVVALQVGAARVGLRVAVDQRDA